MLKAELNKKKEGKQKNEEHLNNKDNLKYEDDLKMKKTLKVKTTSKMKTMSNMKTTSLRRIYTTLDYAHWTPNPQNFLDKKCNKPRNGNNGHYSPPLSQWAKIKKNTALVKIIIWNGQIYETNMGLFLAI